MMRKIDGIAPSIRQAWKMSWRLFSNFLDLKITFLFEGEDKRRIKKRTKLKINYRWNEIKIIKPLFYQLCVATLIGMDASLFLWNLENYDEIVHLILKLSLTITLITKFNKKEKVSKIDLCRSHWSLNECDNS